ncbi:hypothetical protein SLEP1_g59811 [Rubroshorea leprosula]|uniref:Uncharacterized protein n=1 Tax=Rubroshorea leprosula TaxID=152421 RepID=A0AAV5MTF4_9ROSI|nr:hypothetical protein SLEP1_g59811 [Rubroshorea leprosula]
MIDLWYGFFVGRCFSLFQIPPFFVPSHLASLAPLPLLSLPASTVHDEQIWLASRSEEVSSSPLRYMDKKL